MDFKRIWAIGLRQYYLMRGTPARVLPLFAWVAVDILLWGFITKYLGTITSPGHQFVPQLLGAVLLWDFFTRVMHGMSTAFFEDVWSRNFLNVFASPILLSEYLGGLVATSILTSIVGLGVMLLLASTVFGLSLLSYGAMIVPFLLILFLFGIALGILAIAMVLRLGPASEWLIWPIPAIISPFAGVFYPLSTLPAWMRWVGRLLPPSYVFEGMRSVVTSGVCSPAALLGGGVLCVAYVLLAYGFFGYIFRQVVRNGTIARYGAESVS